MPYLKSNWTSIPPLEEFGRFAFGEIFTVPQLTLTQVPGPKACYLHVALEHQSRVAEVELVCTATTIVINILKGKNDAAMNYQYVATIKGEPVPDTPEFFKYRIDNALLADVELWQLQIKFLFPRLNTTSLVVKKISALVDDVSKRREMNMKPHDSRMKKSVMNRSSNDLQAWVPPPAEPRGGYGGGPMMGAMGGPVPNMGGDPTENALVLGLLVVDQVLGTMTKEIQENLETTCHQVEEKLLKDIQVLEDKMTRIEATYGGMNLDKRLSHLGDDLVQLEKSARGGLDRSSMQHMATPIGV